MRIGDSEAFVGFCGRAGTRRGMEDDALVGGVAEHQTVHIVRGGKHVHFLCGGTPQCDAGNAHHETCDERGPRNQFQHEKKMGKKNKNNGSMLSADTFF